MEPCVAIEPCVAREPCEIGRSKSEAWVDDEIDDGRSKESEAWVEIVEIDVGSRPPSPLDVQSHVDRSKEFEAWLDIVETAVASRPSGIKSAIGFSG
jgi:hypothetical protein